MTKGATVEIDSKKVAVENGAFHSLKRKWSGTTTFSLCLPMEAEVISRPNNLFAITRGPLVYSLQIGEYNPDVPGREFPHCDYEILPTTPWNSN